MRRRGAPVLLSLALCAACGSGAQQGANPATEAQSPTTLPAGTAEETAAPVGGEASSPDPADQHPPTAADPQTATGATTEAAAPPQEPPSKAEAAAAPETSTTTAKTRITVAPEPAETVEPAESAVEGLRREYPRFVSSAAPSWPFRGLVQLWPNPFYTDDGRRALGWAVRFWSWDPPVQDYSAVELPGLRVDCLGQVALVSHGSEGIEVGGAEGSVSATYRVSWDGVAKEAAGPSEKLLEEVRGRASNVAVSSGGDRVHVSAGAQARSYAMRDPVRPDGARWAARARHDGELFMLTVHPAHLRCYSGVTWLSLAATGEFVACGANSAATAFVAPTDPAPGRLLLPDPDTTGTYLSCAPRLDLANLPLTGDRTLVP